MGCIKHFALISDILYAMHIPGKKLYQDYIHVHVLKQKDS